MLRAGVMAKSLSGGDAGDVATGRSIAWAAGWDAAKGVLRVAGRDAAVEASRAVTVAVTLGRSRPYGEGDQCSLLRDIRGNPFRPVAADPSWLTSTAVALARGVYEDRAFDRMPILADALQDAGCEHPGILDHCRDDSPHVRGCWVVDLVLGKG